MRPVRIEDDEAVRRRVENGGKLARLALLRPQIGFELLGLLARLLILAAQGEQSRRQMIPLDRLDSRPRRQDFARRGPHADRVAAVRREIEHPRHAAGRMESVFVGKAQKIEQSAIGINRDIVAADQYAERQPIENRGRVGRREPAYRRRPAHVRAGGGGTSSASTSPIARKAVASSCDSKPSSSSSLRRAPKRQGLGSATRRRRFAGGRWRGNQFRTRRAKGSARVGGAGSGIVFDLRRQKFARLARRQPIHMDDAEATIAVEMPLAIEGRQAAEPDGNGGGGAGNRPQNLDAAEGLVPGEGARQRPMRFPIEIFGDVAEIAAEYVRRLGPDDIGERRRDLGDLVRRIRAPEKAHIGPRADSRAEKLAHLVELQDRTRGADSGVRRGPGSRLLARQERTDAEHRRDI